MIDIPSEQTNFKEFREQLQVCQHELNLQPCNSTAALNSTAAPDLKCLFAKRSPQVAVHI